MKIKGEKKERVEFEINKDEQIRITKETLESAYDFRFGYVLKEVDHVLMLGYMEEFFYHKRELEFKPSRAATDRDIELVNLFKELDSQLKGV